MNVEKLEEIIDEVNNGNWGDYSQYFNDDMQLFIRIITKYGLLDNIDPLSDDLGEYQNLVLYSLINENPDVWIPFVCEKVISSDITIRDGKYYLHLSDLTDLSEFFYSGSRGNDTRSVVKSVLSEDWWEPYWDTTDDVYRDVVEELNKENLQALKERVFKELEGQSVSADTELLEELSNDGEDEVLITSDNFSQMFEDEETLRFILKNYADESRQELYSVHSNCYNSAYTDEIYNDIWGELGRFFTGKPEWKSSPIKNSDKTRYWSEIEITDIGSDIRKYLYETSNSGYSQDSLEYLGSYTEMIRHGMDDSIWEYLDFRIPEYPDFRAVDKCINDSFGDYF